MASQVRVPHLRGLIYDLGRALRVKGQYTGGDKVKPVVKQAPTESQKNGCLFGLFVLERKMKTWPFTRGDYLIQG